MEVDAFTNHPASHRTDRAEMRTGEGRRTRVDHPPVRTQHAHLPRRVQHRRKARSEGDITARDTFHGELSAPLAALRRRRVETSNSMGEEAHDES